MPRQIFRASCTFCVCVVGRESLAIFVGKTRVHACLDITHQRIFMYKELTVALFVITTSVFCCRKPEAIRKTTPEPLLAEW